MVLPIYCQSCGATNASECRECSFCGYRLQDKEKAEQPILLNDRYRLLVQVGTGGFGAVYKALDICTDNGLVAIKEINLRGLSAQESIEATDGFHREVRLLSALQHPSLPRIHDWFTDPEHWYLVMDFIEGETLEHYLQKYFPATQPAGLSLSEVLAIGLQLCTVLEYLHTREPAIIFRDLKPDNIIRTPGGQLFLIDFGIARHFTPGKLKDTIPFGSPGYAAPEQYGKAQTTPRADIYSLGVLLHYLLTGNDPAETPFHFAPLRLGGTAEVTALERLIQRMVNIATHDRPASASEVKAELEKLTNRQAGPHIWQPSDLPAPQTPPPGHAVSVSKLIWQYSVARQQQGLASPPARSTRRKFVVGALVVLTAIGGSYAFYTRSLPSITSISTSSSITPVSTSPSAFTPTPANTPTPTSTPTPRTQLVYKGHTAEVTTVAWSSSGEYVASGSADKTIQVWDAGQGTLLGTIHGYTSPVIALTWLDDNASIASAGKSDGTIQIWDAFKDLQKSSTLAEPGRVLALARAWGWLISGRENGTVQSWRAGFEPTIMLTTTYTGHIGPVRAVAANPTQIALPQEPDTGVILIASGGVDRSVQIWEALSGRHIIRYEGHTASVSALAWNQYTGNVGTVANEPVGTVIASASDDGTVQVWRVPDGKLLTKYSLHTGKVNAVSWFFDNQHIASGGDDKTVQVWDPQTGRLVQKYEFPASVRSVACDPIYGNRFVAALDDGTVHLETVKF